MLLHTSVIESYLMCYPTSVKKIQEWRNDILYGTPKRSEIGVRVQESTHSDTVSVAAAKLNHPNIVFLQQMCQAIEHTYNNSNDKIKQFIEEHYWNTSTNFRESYSFKYGQHKVFEYRTQVIAHIREHLGKSHYY